MADGTHISWTDATWNVVTGCSILSPGCTECYAMKLAGTRLRHHPSRAGLTRMTKAGPVWAGEVRFNEAWLDQPLGWTKPRRIFVVAHGDLFHDDVPFDWIDRVFAVMALAPHHQFQVLTKRPHRMLAYIAAPNRYERVLAAARPLRDGRPKLTSIGINNPSAGAFWPHVILGTSIEDQRRADERRTPLADLAELGWRTWVSYEPALSPVDWRGWEFAKWIVSGGESGTRARPSHPVWHRTTRDFCQAHGIPYHFKQHGNWLHMPGRAYFKELSRESWRRVESGIPEVRPALMFDVGKKAAGALLDGREWREFPCSPTS